MLPIESLLLETINRLGRGFSAWLGEPGHRARFAMVVRWIVWLPAALAVGYFVYRAIASYNEDPTGEQWRGWLTWAAAVGLAPTSMQFLFWLRDQARRPDVYLFAEEYVLGSADAVPTSIETERVNLVGKVIERSGEHELVQGVRQADGTLRVGFEVVVNNRGTARVSDGLVNVLAPIECRWEPEGDPGVTKVRVMPPAHSNELHADRHVVPVRYVAFERDFPPNHAIIVRLVLVIPESLHELPVVIILDGEPNHHRRTRITLRQPSCTA